MGIRRCVVRAGLLFGLLVIPVVQHPTAVLAGGADGGYWPNDATDDQLKAADNKVLELQRKRFQALFGKDKEEVKRLDKEFRDLQRERRALLRASGRM